MNKNFWTYESLCDAAAILYDGGYRSTDYDDVLTLFKEEQNDPCRDDPDYKRPSEVELDYYAKTVVEFLAYIEKYEEESNHE